MKAFRASAAIAASLSVTALAAPAQAQVADAVVLEIMRQCSMIEDVPARVACYDNNIRSSSGQSRSTAPGNLAPRPDGPAPALPGNNSATGLGSETVRARVQERPEASAEVTQLSARVTGVSQREPGVYLLTLEDGSQWVFAENVSFGYRAPRSGSTVSIERGSLSSYLMVFDSQQAVRVRRLR